ncbi:MAG: PQQ-binding-like beta-propeller repeat protein [Planctomycetaceae bacterium]|nr:PQQ-binding-like beta-propeller repeat protein [Planctomycetales bacterium]MCB9924256.1 PQQ-binding-like beta-propeller repeat protein [Planctomycetaceae bacterium]
MIFDLAKDFADAIDAMPAEHPRRKMLSLLNEAIRRDIHFIDRHPTTMFQCMWNTCWWYDCPQTSGHYEFSTESPSSQSDAIMSDEMLRWQRHKEEATPGFQWLRALRPPKVRLSSGQIAVLNGHLSGVVAAAWNQAGSQVASCSFDQTVRVWDIRRGDEICCLPLHGESSQVNCIAFAPQGNQLVSSSGRTMRIWDTEGGHVVLTVDLPGDDNVLNCVVYSPDGSRIFSGSKDKLIRVWDAASGQELLRLRGHDEEVVGIAISPDGTRLVSVSNDQTICVWDTSDGQRLLTVPQPVKLFNCVAFSPDGTLVANGTNASLSDNKVCIWDATSGETVRSFEGHTDSVVGVAFSPDGRCVASASYDGTVRVWDIADGSELRCFTGHQSSVRSVAYSPNGEHIATSSDDKTVRIWRPTCDASQRLQGHSKQLRDVRFSPDGQRVATASLDSTVRIWDAFSGKLVVSRSAHGGVSCLDFAPDSGSIVGGSSSTIVMVWDVESGVQLHCLKGHAWQVTHVEYSEDGRQIFSCGANNALYIWDATTGKRLGVKQIPLHGKIARSSYESDFRLVIGGGETRIETATGGDAVSWFPDELVGTFHPSEAIVGAYSRSDLNGPGNQHFYLVKVVASNEATRVENQRKFH